MFVSATIATLAVALFMPQFSLSQGRLTQVEAAATTQRFIEGVVIRNHDGDTITVKLDNGKEENVRLLGIDTAEIAQGKWGARAREYTRSVVGGKRVRIVFDVQERDRYGRLLAYVYTSGNRFLNLELMEQGYAMLLTYPPNVAHTVEFRTAQIEAQAKKLNIWGKDGLGESPHDFRHHGEKAPARLHKSGIKVATVNKIITKRPATSLHSVSLDSHTGRYHEVGCRYFGGKNAKTLTLEEAQNLNGVPCKICH